MEKEMDISQLIDEFETALNAIHNLNLYMEYVERTHQDIFKEMEERFDGLPGYSGVGDD